MSLPKPLCGIVPPLVTPLLDGNTLDVEGLQRLVEHVLDGGVTGLFVLGTTGEAPSLDHGVQRDVVTRVCRLAGGRAPVLVGITDTSFIESIRLARHATAAGASAVVLAPPHYFPLDQADLALYVERICRELPLPLFLYNMPSHTKIHFAPETLRHLSRQEKIIGFKDSSARAGCFSQVREWITRERPDFALMIGPEEMLAESIPLGAHAGICGGANVLPRLFVSLYDAARRGDAPAVAAIQQQVLRLAETIYAIGKRSGGAIIQIKAALACLGICKAHVAEPLHELAPQDFDLVRRNLAELAIEWLTPATCDGPAATTERGSPRWETWAVSLEPQVLNYASPRRSDTYKWWVVGMLWFVCFFNYADRQAIFSVFPVLKAEMGLSDVQLGIVGGAFMWVYAAAGPLAGLVGDRVPRKTLIVGGLIFWSLVTVATALSTRYSHLVFFRAIEGFGEAFYFPAAMSLISDYHGRATRSKAMAICQSSVYAGTIAGGTVAGFLGQYHGWRSGFYLFGSLGVVLGFVLIAMLKEPARGQAESSGEGTADELACGHAPLKAPLDASQREPIGRVLLSIFTHPTILVLIAVFVCANFVASIFLTWMPSFLNRKFSMSLSMAGLNGTAWLQIASVAGVICGGILADRLARRSPAGRMLTQAIGLAAGIPFIFLTGHTLSVPILVLAMAGFGYFKGLYDANIWAALYDVVPPHRRATALGLMNSIGWLGGGVAPVAIALASQRFGMSACLSATSGIYALAVVIYVLGIRAFLRRRETPPAAGFPALAATESSRRDA